MKYFFVFQDESFYEELEGKYIRAPKRTHDDDDRFQSNTMIRVQSGDILFSCAAGKIVALDVANSSCYDESIPSPTDELWGIEGWRVDIGYLKLKKPVKIDEMISMTTSQLSGKHLPFDENGQQNPGYLFEISEAAGQELLKIIGISEMLMKDLNSKLTIQEINRQSKETMPERFLGLGGSERETLIETRVGQGLFKTLFREADRKCAICGISHDRLLLATHIKPWRDSTDSERADPHNILLMCPNHRELFDKGLISFNDEGTLIVSSFLQQELIVQLGLDKNIKTGIDARNEQYFAWHWEKIFLE